MGNRALGEEAVANPSPYLVDGYTAHEVTLDYFIFLSHVIISYLAMFTR